MEERIFTRIDELIGKTPLLRLQGFERANAIDASILGKLEYFNPGGSAKDRIAKRILDSLEESGKLASGSTIIEPTSGNTGIGLAAIGASRGYRVIIVMPGSMSRERQQLMRAYGAELVLTDGALGMKGAIAEAERLAKTIDGAFIAGQFTNPENPAAHRLTTGPEIYSDTAGNLDILVAAVGTGGTLTGVGEYLKKMIPEIRIVAVEPDSSAVLSGEPAGAHAIQGIGAGFIPEILNTDIIDEIVKIGKSEAYEAARCAAKCDGVLLGISSGAALAAAKIIAMKPENRGKRIAVILPDTGERYLSSDLYE